MQCSDMFLFEKRLGNTASKKRLFQVEATERQTSCAGVVEFELETGESALKRSMTASWRQQQQQSIDSALDPHREHALRHHRESMSGVLNSKCEGGGGRIQSDRAGSLHVQVPSYSTVRRTFPPFCKYNVSQVFPLFSNLFSN